MANPPQAPNASLLFGSIGGILQVITAGGIIATVFGLGAMYVQFKRYEIPISLLSLDQAARAGALPTAIFIVVAIYVYLAVRSHFVAFLGVATAALLPMFILIIPFMAITIGIFLGYLAAVIWVVQIMLSSIILQHLPVDMLKLLSIDDLSDETLSFIIANALVLGPAFIGPLGEYLSDRRAAARKTEPVDRAGEHSPSTPNALSAEAHWTETHRWLLIAISAAISPLFVGALFPLRWYLSNLGATELAANVLSTSNILISGVIVFFAIVAFVPVALFRRPTPERNYIFRYIAVGVASAVFLVSLVLYCGWLYPMIPSAFGGGRSEKITIWIKAEDFSEDARQRLRPASCAEIGKVVRCDDVDSLPVGDSYIVLTTKEQPALVISRQSVKSFVLSLTPLNTKPLEQR